MLIILLSLLMSSIYPILPILFSIFFLLFKFLYQNNLKGYLLLLLIIIVGQFGRVPIFSQGAQEVPLMLVDLLAALLVGSWIIKILFRKRRLFFSLTGFLIISFLFFALESSLFSVTYFPLKKVISGSLYLVRWLAYAGLFFVFSNYKNKIRKKLNLSAWLVLFVSFCLAILGLVQYVVFPDLHFAVQYGWDPHLERVVSTFIDPNFVGLFFALGAAYLITLLFKNKKGEDVLKSLVSRKALRHIFIIILWGVLLILVLSLILTYSRSAGFAFAVICLLLGLIYSRKLIVLGLIGGIIIILLFPRVQTRIFMSFDAETSAGRRVESWSNAVKILKDTNYFFGVGFNNYRFAQLDKGFITDQELARSGAGTDSSLLLVWVTTGIGGLVTYLLILISFLLVNWQVYQKSSSKKHFMISRWALVLFCFGIGLLFHSQLVNSLLYPFILPVFFGQLGLLFSYLRIARRKF